MATRVDAWRSSLDGSLHATEKKATEYDVSEFIRRIARSGDHEGSFADKIMANSREAILLLQSYERCHPSAPAPQALPSADDEKGPARRDPSDLAAEIKRIADGLVILARQNDKTKSFARQWLGASRYADLADFTVRTGIDDVLSFQRHMAANCPHAYVAVFGQDDVVRAFIAEHAPSKAEMTDERPCDTEPAAETHGDMS